jgi:hypothetical protein
MNEKFIYTAGLVDGEGTITLSQRKHKSIHFFKNPVISVASTTWELVEFLKETFGGHISSKKKYKSHHKQSYAWCVTNDNALDFIQKILPYMREPNKMYRAQLLLNEYKTVTQRNGRYSYEQREAKLDFEKRFFLINQHPHKGR